MSLRIHPSLPLVSAFGDMGSAARSATDKLEALIARRPGSPVPPSRENATARLGHLERSDLVIASLLTPCFQVGAEIERAFARGIPILFIAWGRPSHGGVYPQLSGFPPHDEYARGINPLVIGEEWALEIEHRLEERLNDPALLEIVRTAAEKRHRSRLSTSGFPEL